ncbi:RraA-like protein [Amylostereum chailletii]|nr:RraA-like protein [Amylostereum chailletii]
MSNSILADYSSCEISDALLKLGVPHGGHIPDLRPFSPSEDARICGPAYTVRMVLTSDASAPKLQGHFVDMIPEGTVAFIAAPPEAQNAVWGGLMTAGAKVRGCRGTIVYGRVRDVVEHRAASHPVFARGTSTVGQSPYTRAAEVQVPVTVNAEAGPGGLPPVQINPGDILVADTDGVVCVPKELEIKVAERAAEGRAVDARCAEDIARGVGVAESFKRHRGKGKL